MSNLDVFEIEPLEERFEFTAPGFWLTLWDCVCWIAESAWDVMQTLWNTANLTSTYSENSSGIKTITMGTSYNGFFHELGNAWQETWTKYWNESEQ